MTQWTNIRLGDVCIKIGSGATPRGGSKVYSEQGKFALIRSQNIHNEGFRREGLVFISGEHAEGLKNVEVLPGDVLLNITGDSVARCCQVPSDVLPARVNQHVAIIRPDPTKLDPRFLRYVLVSPQMQMQLLSWARSGGTRNALTKSMIETLEINAPADVGEQRAIAHILGTLDDKIERLRRMSETLEEMARALFKAWFVDFVPVRAKMEGHWKRGQSLPGLPAHLYDLFPDRLVPSELGKIPEGWEIQHFADIVTQIREPIVPYMTPNTIFKHFSIPAFDNGQWPHNEIGAHIKSQKLVVPPNAILLSKLNPEVERVWLADVQPGENAVCSTEFMVLLPQYPYGKTSIYSLVRSRIFRETLKGLVTGTSKSHQRVRAADILNIPALKPPKPLVSVFEQASSPLLERTLQVRRESHTLTALRDALLPKLIRGEIRVKDAERFLKERGL